MTRTTYCPLRRPAIKVSQSLHALGIAVKYSNRDTEPHLYTGVDIACWLPKPSTHYSRR